MKMEFGFTLVGGAVVINRGGFSAGAETRSLQARCSRSVVPFQARPSGVVLGRPKRDAQGGSAVRRR